MPSQVNRVEQVLDAVTYTWGFEMPYVVCLAAQLDKGAHLSYLLCHVYQPYVTLPLNKQPQVALSWDFDLNSLPPKSSNFPSRMTSFG